MDVGPWVGVSNGRDYGGLVSRPAGRWASTVGEKPKCSFKAGQHPFLIFFLNNIF